MWKLHDITAMQNGLPNTYGLPSNAQKVSSKEKFFHWAGEFASPHSGPAFHPRRRCALEHGGAQDPIS